MNSKPSPRIVAVVGLLAFCCCLSTLGALGIVSWVVIDSQSVSLAAVAPSPTATRIRTSLPDPESTTAPTPTGLVAKATFTPVAILSNPTLYTIVVPTPTAPPMIYPIQFDSSLNLVTYPVTGTTLVALGKSLDANALPDPHERTGRYYARTDWYLSGHWNWQPTLRGCEVDGGSVSIAMTITVPILSSTLAVPVDVINRWNVFVGNTVTHETGHVKLNLQGARDYERALGNFPPAGDCNVLQSKLKTLFDDNFSAIDRSNTNYDAVTRHGRTQGAVFP